MPSKDAIIQEIEQMPEFLLEEILSFLQRLKQQHLRERLEVSALSEAALAKDWLRVEEEEAWQDL
jgi:hypothetical protein